MTEKERVRDFLVALSALTREHGISIDGLLDPPNLFDERGGPRNCIADVLTFERRTRCYRAYVGREELYGANV